MTGTSNPALEAAMATRALRDPFLSDRTRVKILLEAAAPHIAAHAYDAGVLAERERIRQLAIGKWERDTAERRNLWPSMAIEGSRIYQAGYADALDGCVHELRTLLTDPEGGQADGT